MASKKYKCLKCGCDEFITQLNRYDVFEAEGKKLVFKNTEWVDEKIELFCRDCSEKLAFDEDHLIM